MQGGRGCPAAQAAARPHNDQQVSRQGCRRTFFVADHPTAPSTSAPNFLLRQQARRFGQVAALALVAFLVLGVANLLRGNNDQGATLMAAALATGLALRLHERQRTANAAFALTATCTVVVFVTSWMGTGLMDTGNYAFPGILVLASLLLDRARFIASVGLVLLALGTLGAASMLGWRQWPGPAIGPWHLLDMAVITLTSAGVAALVVDEIRRAVDAMQLQQAALHQGTERLAASEARFRGLFETAPVGLARLDAQGFIVDANEKLCDLLGRERSSLAGLRPEQLCLAADWPQLRNALAQRGIPGIDPAALELRLTHADGHAMEVRINLTRRTNDYGHGYEHGHGNDGGNGHGDASHGTMLSVEDVTPHRRIRQLEHDKAAAEAMTRAQTEFLSRMSHELRTPLNAMLGYAQLMREDANVDGNAQLRHRLQVVEGAGWHLAAMINDILDLSRLQAGSLPLKPVPTALTPLLDEALAMMAGEAEAQQVVFERLDTPDAQLWVMADATRLRQVLANLLSNAIKYNRAGGWVKLGARRVVIHGQAHVELQVRDNGLGFSTTQLDHLFEPFNRLGREASAQSGTGIGLVITRSLVELMGGRLSVSSSEGQGSTFSVRLAVAEPRTPDTSAAAADTPAFAELAAAGYGERHVVYIEDNAVNGEIMLAILRTRPQIRLDLHADGEAGLAAVRAEPPDLLLLDLQLGRVNGLDILAALRADPRTAKLPVLVVSADVLPTTVAAVRAAGAQGFIEKPLDLAKTLQRVDAAFAADAPPVTA